MEGRLRSEKSFCSLNSANEEPELPERRVAVDDKDVELLAAVDGNDEPKLFDLGLELETNDEVELKGVFVAFVPGSGEAVPLLAAAAASCCCFFFRERMCSYNIDD